MIYPNTVTPVLSPVYDIVTTRIYMEKDLPMDDDHKAALKARWRNLHPDFRLERS